MENTNKVAFWEYVGTDAEGNVTIKILNKEAQLKLAELVAKGDEKATKEAAAKKAKDAAVTLADVEAFDNLVTELVNTDAVYVVANKQTGRNIAIDWDKVGSKNGQPKNKTSKATSGTTNSKHTVEAIKVDATFDF
jgi:predicted DNA-binding WGR domain protein